MLANPVIQIIALPNIKRKILQALKDVNKEFFFFHAETERFELSIEFPLYTLSRRAPSATRTRLLFLFFCKTSLYTLSPDLSGLLLPPGQLSFFKGRQKYSINLYMPNIFWALAVVTAAISLTGIFFTCANFSIIYFK